MKTIRVCKTVEVSAAVSEIERHLSYKIDVPGCGEYESSAITIEREGDLWSVSATYVRRKVYGTGFVIVE